MRHVAFEDLGLFEPVLRSRGYEVQYVQAGLHAVSAFEWMQTDLVVVLGGPVGVADAPSYPWLNDEIALVRQRLSRQRPLLGICLGAQMMAAALDARVAPMPAKEIGWAPVSLSVAGNSSPLRHLQGLDVLHWHGDAFALPHGAELLASTPATACQAFRVGTAALALQFHPEADAARMEPWLIAHTSELSSAAVDVNSLRRASELQPGGVRAGAAERLLNEWLDHCPPSTD